MPALSAAALRAQLAAGEAGPLYLLVGADAVERSAVAAEFVGLVEEELRPFNVERHHGADVTVDALIDAANVFPLMAPRRVVIVLDAESLLAPKIKRDDEEPAKRLSASKRERAAAEESERLEHFIKDPAPHATVVFVCGALDMRRRVSQLLLREAPVVDCGTIEDPAGAERWVRARAAQERAPLDSGAARAIVERAGLDIGRLRAALERVALYAMGRPAITAADVKASVVPGPEARADFGIAKAIWRNDAAEALRELSRATESGASPFLLLGQLRAAAEKVSSDRLSAAIGAVLRTDLAMKSSGGDPNVLLERLVVELCAPRGRAGRPTRP